jgi:AsmA protein
MKILKYALIALGGLILIVGAVAAYVAATFDPNAYKPQIIQLVKDKTQRTLKLDGDIRLAFWPSIGADLGKLSLSEARSEKEFLSVEGARLSLALMPLLSRQLVVDEIRVKGARASITRFKDGRTSIDDLTGGGAAAPGAPKPAPAGEFKFDVAHVVIEDSAFNYRDEATGAQYALSKVNLRTGRIASGVPSRIELSAALQGNQPRIDITTDLKTRLTFDLDKQVYALDDLALQVKGRAADITNLALKAGGGVTARLKTGEFSTDKLSVALTGTSGKDSLDIKLDAPRLNFAGDKASGERLTIAARVSGPQGTTSANVNLPGIEGSAKAFKSSAMTLDLDMKQGDLALKAKIASPVAGNIQAQQVNLPQLKASLSAAGPNLPGKSLSGELSGSASIDAGKQNVQANLAGKVADSTIKARLGVAGFAPPALSFDIDIDQLDVDRYLPPKPAAAAGGGAAGGAQKQAEQPFDLTGLRNLRASGTLRIGSLKASNVKASNVRLDIKANGGRVEVSPLAANLYQGALAGAVSINAAPATPTFAVRQNLQGVNIGPLLKDLANNDTLEGRGNVALDVTTQGNTVSALKKALNGTAGVRLTDGAVKGIDIAGTIRSAKARLGTLRGEQTQQADAKQKTDFSELNATFAIKNGVAHNNDLDLKSPLLRVGGQGEINIGEDTLNYLVKASIVATSRGQGGRELEDLRGITVPVRVAGPLASPTYRLDFASIATDVAKQKIQEAVTGRIQERLGGGAAKDAGKDAAKGTSPQDAIRGLFRR